MGSGENESYDKKDKKGSPSLDDRDVMHWINFIFKPQFMGCFEIKATNGHNPFLPSHLNSFSYTIFRVCVYIYMMICN